MTYWLRIKSERDFPWRSSLREQVTPPSNTSFTTTLKASTPCTSYTSTNASIIDSCRLVAMDSWLKLSPQLLGTRSLLRPQDIGNRCFITWTTQDGVMMLRSRATSEGQWGIILTLSWLPLSPVLPCATLYRGSSTPAGAGTRGFLGITTGFCNFFSSRKKKGFKTS